MWGGSIRFRTAMLFSMGFVAMFTIGGLSGVTHAVSPHDRQQTDTYYVVAHFHYVLFGGALFGIMSGIYYWYPKVFGRMLDERLGKLHFWTTFIFFNATFGPMHIIGVQGMPRRVADYSEQFATWNLIISISSFVVGISTLVFLYNMVVSWRGGPRATSNPWNALTLEWQVSSPPPIFNFDEIPTVVGSPYEYGVPGAVHGIFKDQTVAKPKKARTKEHA
jgi:cytochrome c oxidase subunit 1